VAIALVTGTSSGIGLATAVTLARGGHKVIAGMRNLDEGGELRKIVLAEGLPVNVTALNVDDDGSVSDAVNRVLACVVANPSPPSGWAEDFHLQATEHVQHTTKSLRDSGGARLGRGVLTRPEIVDSGAGCPVLGSRSST
jgi:NAD(P)-dependent dehydrogenase (short-subunit alcohol dehydrogenase family)